MSLSMNGGLGNNVPCDDLEQQTISALARIPSGDVTGSTFEEALINDYEVAGGLDRDEVAELVAAHYQFYVTWDNASNPADSFVLFADYELTTDGDAETLGTSTGGASGADNLDGTNLQLLERSGDSTSPDIVHVGQAMTQGSFEDEANGSGGGGGTATVDEAINYREIGSEGPTFDRHNDLNLHMSLGNRNLDDAGIVAGFRAVLWWNVVERC